MMIEALVVEICEEEHSNGLGLRIRRDCDLQKVASDRFRSAHETFDRAQ